MLINHEEQLAYLGNQFEEYNGYDFYRYIFPDNEIQGDLNVDFSKPNAIYLYQDEKDKGTKRRLRRRIMLKDTWEDDYMGYVECNQCTLCSGLTYRGRTNKIDKAQRMNALIIDLDGVGLKELRNLFLRFDKDPTFPRTLPKPTFIVSSGTGIHLYYVFEQPVDLYPNIKLQLKTLKYNLTFRVWEYKSTSQNKEIQQQSINQGFRMVGSFNDKYDILIRAFKTGEKLKLDYLNQYVREEFRVDVNKPFKPSKMTREQAREAYPDWYQRVIVEKNKKLKKWKISEQKGHNGDELYNWWLRQVDQIRGGHRYFFLMCMSIYACKCDIPKKRLKKDMLEIFDKLQEIEHDNPMTEYDIESALEAYSKEYYNFTISDIEKLTDVRIERNKRNGRTRSQHVKYMNGIKNLKKQIGEPINEGRPNKEWEVKNHIKYFPNKTVSQIARELGVSRTTVYKYM